MSILENQTLAFSLLILLIFALADWVVGTLTAIKGKTFDSQHFTDWLVNHLVLRVALIGFFFVLAALIDQVVAAFPNADSATHTAVDLLSKGVWVTAFAALLSYADETLGSLKSSLEAVTGKVPPVT
jgi:hypothetical protein